MKFFLIIIITFVSFQTFGQQTDYYIKKGYVAKGYDVTEYFNNKAVEGNSEFTTEYDGVKFKFANQANLDKFKANPDRFTPQYGGYCAYAIAYKGKKVGVNPKTFEIRDGKLYLFYNSLGTNTLEKWKEEGPEKLKGQADAAWNEVKYKKK